MSASAEHANGNANDLDSISSFSSLGSDNTSYKKKFEEEKERSSKLEERLAGYKTVVGQLPKCHEHITELQRRDAEKKKEIDYLRRQLLEFQLPANESQQRRNFPDSREIDPTKDSQGLTDLGSPHSRGNSTRGTSESFVVIGKTSCSDSVEKIRSEHSKDLQPFVNQCFKDVHKDREQAHTQSTHENTSDNVNNIGQKVSGTYLQQHLGQCQSQQNLKSEENNSHTHNPHPWGRQPVLKAYSDPYNAIGSAAQSQLLRGYSTAFENTRSSVPSSPKASYPVASGGLVSVLAFNGRPAGVTPAWKMAQAGANHRTGSSGSHNPVASSVTTHTLTNTNNIFDIPPQYRTVSATPANQLQMESYGIGARPKEWKPLNIKTASEGQTFLKEKETFGFELVPGPGQAPAPPTKMNDLSQNTGSGLTNLDLGTTPAAGDLMKFPSLTSGSPTNQVLKDKGEETINPLFSQQPGGVANPTDDHPPLASRAENMASILKTTDASSGISERLLQFAQDAAKLETKLNENQALIQRQQVQIQSFSKQNKMEELLRLKEENASLKEENANLLAFMAAQKEAQGNISSTTESSRMPLQNLTDPVWSHYPDSPVMKKMKKLEDINARLFLANKDWHTKWEILRQENQTEKEELEAIATNLNTENQKLKDEQTEMDEELQMTNRARQDAEEAKAQIDSENSQNLRFIESLKSDVHKLTADRRRLEREVANLKQSVKNKSTNSGNQDLTSENTLLKQQMALYAEDFERERRDRTNAESKVDKLRKERDSVRQTYEAKLKKAQIQIRKQEEDLRAKSRQYADLQYQVEDLKEKLRRAQINSTTCGTSNQPPASGFPVPSSTYQQPNSMLYPTGGYTYRPAGNNVAQSGTYGPSAGLTRQMSPEHLPGAWQCQDCTYINYPDRTVCDICGNQNIPDGSFTHENGSGRPELQSRGEQGLGVGSGNDVVVDTA